MKKRICDLYVFASKQVQVALACTLIKQWLQKIVSRTFRLAFLKYVNSIRQHNLESDFTKSVNLKVRMLFHFAMSNSNMGMNSCLLLLCLVTLYVFQ